MNRFLGAFLAVIVIMATGCGMNTALREKITKHKFQITNNIEIKNPNVQNFC